MAQISSKIKKILFFFISIIYLQNFISFKLYIYIYFVVKVNLSIIYYNRNIYFFYFLVCSMIKRYKLLYSYQNIELYSNILKHLKMF